LILFKDTRPTIKIININNKDRNITPLKEIPLSTKYLGSFVKTKIEKNNKKLTALGFSSKRSNVMIMEVTPVEKGIIERRIMINSMMPMDGYWE